MSINFNLYTFFFFLNMSFFQYNIINHDIKAVYNIILLLPINYYYIVDGVDNRFTKLTLSVFF